MDSITATAPPHNSTPSLHDALPISASTATPTTSGLKGTDAVTGLSQSFDSANTGARTLAGSEEHMSELESQAAIFCGLMLEAEGSIDAADLDLNAVTDAKTYDATTA